MSFEKEKALDKALDDSLEAIKSELGREFTNRELGVIKVMRKYRAFKPYIYKGGLRFEKE